MTYAPYEMSADSPDLRSPALRQEQRATFDHAMTRARDVQSRERAERWSPERSWGERLPGATRKWASATDLATYLASEWTYHNGKAPTAEDRAKIDRVAQAMWTRQESERVVPPSEVA